MLSTGGAFNSFWVLRIADAKREACFAHATISSESYEYDAAGNLVEKTVNSVTTEYAYDDIDQLVSEVRNGYSASYTYDANGNRTSKTLNGTTQSYVVDDADKLTSITQGGNTVKSFTYDAAGRTTAVTVGNDTTSIAYDYESRIAQITYPNQSTNSFSYNGLDTRVSKVDSTGTRTYLRDGAYVTDPVLSDGAATYTPAISERRSSTTTFYHTGIKNGDSQTNTSESVTASVQYDAFGNVTSSSGTWSGPFAYGGPYGYQSDSDSGLKLLGHRYYDPSTGRFLTRDPVKDGRNWYSYCGASPLTRSDPSGTISWRKLRILLAKLLDDLDNPTKSSLKNLGIPARIGLEGDWRVGWAHPGRVSG